MSLAPFLPHHLVRRLAALRRPPRTPRVDRFSAALLFSDISGFTALTERLQSRGDQGAEEIAAIVNAVFRPAIRRVVRHGGSVVGFAGDSMLALFPGTRGVARAEAVARGIGGVLPGAEVAGGPVTLRLAHVIHAGTVHGIHLSHEGRYLYVVGGPALAALARQESRSRPGEVLLSPAARRRLGRARGGLVPEDVPPRPQLPCWAAAYVGLHVRESVRWFRGEYRRMAIAFFESRGASVARLQRHYGILTTVLERHDAALVGVDASPYGVRWLCMFGMPRPHEDDAERAAAAALDVLAAAGDDMRGGMHVGTVAAIWMGGESRRSLEGIGDATNTAARTLSRARWGEVLVTGAMRSRLPGIEAAVRGSHAVQGKRTPLELFAIKRSRRVVRVEQMSATLVGRDAEIGRLKGAIAAAARGEGRVVAISGEPGLGKSRLKWEACRMAVELGFHAHEGRTRALGGRPYEPVADLLRGALGIGEEDGTGATWGRLRAEGRTRRLGEPDVEHLAEMLGARRKGSPLAHLDAAALLHNNARALARFLEALAAERPRIVVLEDLQWADELTLAALPKVAAAARACPILLVFVHRPGFVPPAVDDAIALAELQPPEVEGLVRGLLGGAAPMVAARVLEKAGGNPFYVEEVVRFLRDRGMLLRNPDGSFELDGEAPELPPSLEGVVDARLGQLPPRARRLVQVGAVIGRRFSRTLLGAFPEIARRQEEQLRLLEARQLIFSEPPDRPGGRSPGFVFKHALTRDAAYAGILLAERRRIHRRVAQTLERGPVGARKPLLGVLAHHWEQAGERERARTRFAGAARHACAAFAFDEAERHYRATLRLEAEPSADGGAIRNELAERVLGVLGRLEEARVLHAQAAAIYAKVGDRAGHAAALKGIGVVDMGAGRMESARASFEEALRILPKGRLRVTRAIVQNSLGALYHREGRLDVAARLMRSALRVHQADGDAQRAGVVLGNLGILREIAGDHARAERLYVRALALHRHAGDRRAEGRTLNNLASLKMMQGRFGEAEDMTRQALALQRSIGNRVSEGVALGNLAFVHRRVCRFEDSERESLEALAIAREIGDHARTGLWLTNLANLELLRGRFGRSRELSLEGLDAMVRSGVVGEAARCDAILAELERLDGRFARAATLIARAAARIVSVPHVAAASYVSCTAGWIALQRGDLDAAKHLLEIALERARTSRHGADAATALLGLAAATMVEGRLPAAQALLDEATGLLQSPDTRAARVNAITLRVHLARLGGDGSEVAHAKEAVEIVEGTELAYDRCIALAELGISTLRAGRDASELLARARALLATLDVGPRSAPALLVSFLGRAAARRREPVAAYISWAPAARGGLSAERRIG